MQRETLLFVAVVVASLAVLPLLPGADAALPLDKDWDWSNDVDGNVQAVAICKSEDCASSRMGTATGNGASGTHDNLYAHSRSNDQVWGHNPEESEEADFVMNDVDLHDVGDKIASVSNKRASSGILENNRGAFWVRKATAQDTNDWRADGTSSDTEGNVDRAEHVKWIPGDRRYFSVLRASTGPNNESTLWLFNLGNRSAVWGEPGPARHISASHSIVDMQVSEGGPSKAWIAVGMNDDGSPRLGLYSVENRRTGLVADDGDLGFGTTLGAVAAARSSDFVVASGEETMSLLKVNLAPSIQKGNVEKLVEHTPDWDIDDVAISADGQIFAFAGDGGIQVYRQTPNGDEPDEQIWSVSRSVDGIKMSPDGAHLVAWDSTGIRFYLVEPPGDEAVALWKNQDMSGGIVDIDVGYAGTGTIVGTDGGVVYFFDLDYSMGLSADTTDRTLTPGEENPYTLTLENTGDAVNRITFNVDSQKSDWVKIKVGDDDPKRAGNVGPLTLLPEKKRTLEVHVTPPPGTAAGTDFSGKITAVASNAPTSVKADVSLSGNVEETHAVGLSADRTSQAVEQGGTATFDLKVTNDGNLEDRIQLSLGPTSSGWEAVLAQTSFEMDAGESINTTLTLAAPEQVGRGHVERVTVTGTSEGDTSVQEQLDLQASVGATTGVRVEAPTQVTAKPGQETSIAARINNTGNTGGTFNLDLQAPGTWAVTLSTDQTTLSPGQVEDVTVTVVPPSSESGVATVKLSATAAGDPTRNDQAAIIVQIDSGVLGVPGFQTLAALAALAVGFGLSKRRRR